MKKFRLLRNYMLIALSVALLFCSVPSVPVFAAEESSDAAADDSVYTLTVSFYRENSASTSNKYYDYYEYEFSADGQLFLYGDSQNDSALSTMKYYKLGYLNSDGVCVFPSKYTSSIFVNWYLFRKYSVSDGSIFSYSKSDELRVSSVSDFTFFIFNSSGHNSISCDGYIFTTLGAAQAYFDDGLEDGLVQRPVVVPPKGEDPDPGSHGDVEPEGFWAEVLSYLNKVFGAWSFSDFLDFIGTSVFGGLWKFGDFLSYVKNEVFGGTWSFAGFRDFVKNDIFGGEWSFSSLVDSILAKIDEFSMKDFLEHFDTVFFGGHSVTSSFYDIVEGYLERLNFPSINSMFELIRDNFLSVIDNWRHFNLQDFFEEVREKFQEAVARLQDMDLMDVFGSVRDKFNDFLDDLRERLGIDSEGSFWDNFFSLCINAFLKNPVVAKFFVPDEEYIANFMEEFRDRFPGLFSIFEAGSTVVSKLSSISSGTPPVITVPLGASTSFDLGDAAVTIDFSWYAPYKPTVDVILAGLIWLGFIWRLYSRLPEIIHGAGMIISAPYKIDSYEIRNERIQEQQRRSDVRWDEYVYERNKRGRNIS